MQDSEQTYKEPTHQSTTTGNRDETTIPPDSVTIPDTSQIPPEEIKRLVHELQVHQSELEIQNDEMLKTQLALQASLKRYFDLYETAPVGYITLNRKGMIQKANLRFADLVGIDQHRLIGKPFTVLVSREYQDIFYLALQQAYETRRSGVLEIKLMHTNGASFYTLLLYRIAPGDDLDYESLRIVVIDVDGLDKAKWHIEGAERLILHANQELEKQLKKYSRELRAAQESLVEEVSSKLRAQESLRDSNEVLRAIFESARDCIIVKDKSLLYVKTNRAFQRLFQKTESEIIGQCWPDAL